MAGLPMRLVYPRQDMIPGGARGLRMPPVPSTTSVRQDVSMMYPSMYDIDADSNKQNTYIQTQQPQLNLSLAGQEYNRDFTIVSPTAYYGSAPPFTQPLPAGVVGMSPTVLGGQFAPVPNPVYFGSTAGSSVVYANQTSVRGGVVSYGQTGYDSTTDGKSMSQSSSASNLDNQAFHNSNPPPPQQQQQIDSASTMENIRNSLKTQLEYYFSPENLSKDAYMRKIMDEDEGGYVSIALVSEFPRMRTLSHDLDASARLAIVRELFSGMSHIDMDPSREKVRPSMNRQRHTILLGNIPAGTAETDIINLFKSDDCPECLNHQKASDTCWYVGFKSEDDAIKAYSLIHSDVIKLNGKTITASIKDKVLSSATSTTQKPYEPKLITTSRPQQQQQQLVTPIAAASTQQTMLLAAPALLPSQQFTAPPAAVTSSPFIQLSHVSSAGTQQQQQQQQQPTPAASLQTLAIAGGLPLQVVPIHNLPTASAVPPLAAASRTHQPITAQQQQLDQSAVRPMLPQQPTQLFLSPAAGVLFNQQSAQRFISPQLPAGNYLSHPSGSLVGPAVTAAALPYITTSQHPVIVPQTVWPPQFIDPRVGPLVIGQLDVTGQRLINIPTDPRNGVQQQQQRTAVAAATVLNNQTSLMSAPSSALSAGSSAPAYQTSNVQRHVNNRRGNDYHGDQRRPMRQVQSGGGVSRYEQSSAYSSLTAPHYSHTEASAAPPPGSLSSAAANGSSAGGVMDRGGGVIDRGGGGIDRGGVMEKGGMMEKGGGVSATVDRGGVSSTVERGGLGVVDRGDGLVDRSGGLVERRGGDMERVNTETGTDSLSVGVSSVCDIIPPPAPTDARYSMNSSTDASSPHKQINPPIHTVSPHNSYRPPPQAPRELIEGPPRYDQRPRRGSGIQQAGRNTEHQPQYGNNTAQQPWKGGQSEGVLREYNPHHAQQPQQHPPSSRWSGGGGGGGGGRGRGGGRGGRFDETRHPNRHSEPRGGNHDNRTVTTNNDMSRSVTDTSSRSSEPRTVDEIQASSTREAKMGMRRIPSSSIDQFSLESSSFPPLVPQVEAQVYDDTKLSVPHQSQRHHHHEGGGVRASGVESEEGGSVHSSTPHHSNITSTQQQQHTRSSDNKSSLPGSSEKSGLENMRSLSLTSTDSGFMTASESLNSNCSGLETVIPSGQSSTKLSYAQIAQKAGKDQNLPSAAAALSAAVTVAVTDTQHDSAAGPLSPCNGVSDSATNHVEEEDGGRRGGDHHQRPRGGGRGGRNFYSRRGGGAQQAVQR